MRPSCAFATRSACWCIHLILISALCACTGGAVKSGGDGKPADAQIQAASAVRPAFQLPVAVNRLLDQADIAYQRGRYTLPAQDNAVDRYQAALLLDPQNARAQAGLDTVLLAYIDQVRAALSAGRIGAAQEMIQRGRELFDGSPLLQQLENELQQAQASARREREAASDNQPNEGERVDLPVTELNRRDDTLVQTLKELATRVSSSEESVMIYARNDREGRWIYKVLQDAAGDHRIRGDIRISSVPYVVLMEPL